MIVLKMQYLGLIILILTMGSCASNKKITIFSELKDETSSPIVVGKIDKTIKSGDILQITIFSQDEMTKQMLNNSAAAAAGVNSVSGYLVDDSGCIKFPLLGSVKCSGLSKEQLEDTMAMTLIGRKLVLDPIVSIRISNFKITLLGEVNRPGVFNIQNERISIIEAIGLAGDLTVFAQRNNILLIREENGKRYYKRFSLNDEALFSKDFYYLQNQDILYVEPSKGKAATIDRSTQYISLGLTALSVIMLIYIQLTATVK